MARILVTAATGRVGSALLPLLMTNGHDVVAVTSREEGVAALNATGASGARVDLRDPAALDAHLYGVDAVFLATADDPRQDAIETALIDMLAQRDGLHVVKLSAQSAGLDPPVSFGTFHRRSETALEQSGLPFTILRPTFFMQSLLLFADDVAGKGRIIAPVDKGRIAMVDINDVARAAAAVLANPDHHGRTYTLTGPAVHSFGDVVETLSARLDRTVRHISPPALLARLVMPLATGMPRWQTNLIVDLLTALKAGAQETVSNDVAAITGQAATGLDDFLDANMDAFRP